jgi:chromosome segregation ATPase
VQQEGDASIKAVKAAVHEQEQKLMEANNSLTRCELEAENVQKQLKKLAAEADATRIELHGLSSARKDLVEADREYIDAKRTHDEFMATYKERAADFTKKLKASYCYN